MDLPWRCLCSIALTLHRQSARQFLVHFRRSWQLFTGDCFLWKMSENVWNGVQFEWSTALVLLRNPSSRHENILRRAYLPAGVFSVQISWSQWEKYSTQLCPEISANFGWTEEVLYKTKCPIPKYFDILILKIFFYSKVPSLIEIISVSEGTLKGFLEKKIWRPVFDRK